MYYASFIFPVLILLALVSLDARAERTPNQGRLLFATHFLVQNSPESPYQGPDDAEVDISESLEPPYDLEEEIPGDDMPLVTQTLVEEVPATEAALLSQIHSINQQKIRLGQLTEERAEDSKLKAYGDRLFRDHRMVDRQILAIAETMALDLGTAHSPVADLVEHAEAAKLSELEDLSGADYDGAFLQMMEHGHRRAIDLLLRSRNQLAADSKVREFAIRMIPILQQHLNVVLYLQGKEQI